MFLSTAPASTAVASESRRRPAWIPTLAAIVTVALCVTAGNWQHRRMQEKEALEAQLRSAAHAAPVALPVADDWQPWRFRTVMLHGEFDARRQFLVDNKVHEGRVGFVVVAPLVLADGRVVLVDRGFVPLGESRANLPDPPVPSGVAAVRAQIDLPARPYFGAETPPPNGRLWQHLDPARFTEVTGVGVLPIVVHALDAPPDAGLAPDVAAPDTGVAKHLGYMLQWYAFAAMTAGLWLWFTLRRRLRARADAGR